MDWNGLIFTWALYPDETVLLEKGINKPIEFLIEVVRLVKERATFALELWEVSEFFFLAPTSYDEKAAKNWIARHESSYSYTARNGNCYGRYQLLRAYLHGDYSPVNQERAANRYVSGRYGTWTHAKHFWQAHHWY